MRRTQHVHGEIDFNPGGARDIGNVEDLAAFAQQVAHRFLMRHVGAVAFDIARHQCRKPARAGLIEAKESHRFADGVVLQVRCQLFAQFDRHTGC